MLAFPGTHVILQEFTLAELHDPRYFQWLRDLGNARNFYRMEYLKPLSFAAVEDYVQGLLASPNDCLFAIRLAASGEFIGTLKIGHIDWRSGVADLGLMIGPKESKGKGLAKEAVALGCEYAFLWLGLRRLTGGTFADNPAMIRCFQAAGFVQEGVLRKQLLVGGEHLDHHLFGLLREEYLAAAKAAGAKSLEHRTEKP